MVSAPRQPESLGDYTYRHLNLPLDFEGPFTVQHVANVALLATAHSPGYAATQHLVALMMGIPTPTDEPYEDFWFKFWKASGSAYFMPGNMRYPVVAAVDGSGTGLANQLLSGIAEMSPKQRAAAAAVVGNALGERFSPLGRPEQNGELWLQDIQLTAWRVLYSDSISSTWDERAAFREGWKTA